MKTGNRLLRTSAALLYVTGAMVAFGGFGAQANPVYVFRAKPTLITSEAPPESEHGAVKVALEPTLPFGLTTGVEVSIPLVATGDAEDVTYRAAASAIMPGLSVDPSTGTVAGTPSGSEGDSYSIVVEAVRDGEAVAATPAISRILRTPLVVDVVPSDINLTAGDDFPISGVAAGATGGDQDSIVWSLENAPQWLAISEIGPGAAILQQAAGEDIVDTEETRVTLVASDAEGREDRSHGFSAVVRPSMSKLLASDGAPGDTFGSSVSISGDTAVVGVKIYAPQIGQAYLFQKSGGAWTQVAKLVPGDGRSGDQFGWDVAVSGDIAIVGAVGDDDNGANSGSAFVFEDLGGVWTQVAKLTATDGAAGDFFGNSVSISGDTAVIGASGAGVGAAYIFKDSGGVWTQVAKLVATDGVGGVGNGSFGYSVAISGDTVIVGATNDNAKGTYSGSAYVFQNYDGVWTQVGKLIAADGSEYDNFGRSVSISGSTAIIGSYTDEKGAYSGSAYVFQNSGGGWTQVTKLMLADGATYDEFGDGVSISGDTAIVTASGRHDQGSAYVFRNSSGTWNQTAELRAADGEAGDRFGQSVGISMDGTTALVGAAGDNSGTGSAYALPVH
jgi:hypothetical protein